LILQQTLPKNYNISIHRKLLVSEPIAFSLKEGVHFSKETVNSWTINYSITTHKKELTSSINISQIVYFYETEKTLVLLLKSIYNTTRQYVASQLHFFKHFILSYIYKTLIINLLNNRKLIILRYLVLIRLK